MKVDYIDHMGDDDRAANVARVSFAYDFQVRPQSDNRKLTKYLAEHNHWTPLAHNQLTLRIEAPIPIARQFFKHTVGIVNNEESRRYVDTTPSIYYPEWRARPSKYIKQGSGEAKPSTLASGSYYVLSRLSVGLYRLLIWYGIAPEQARFALIQGVNTSWISTASLVTWARIYKLRSDPHAQKEIQEIARQINQICKQRWPHTWQVLTGS